MVAESLAAHAGEALSVLLLVPTEDREDDEACVDLLSMSDPAETNVLSVTLSESADERYAIWARESGDASPHRATILGTPEATETADVPAPITVDALPADAELVDVAMAIARTVGEWSDDDERTTAVCLHSLTALLEEFERDHVIGFVNAFNALCDADGIVAHHHMDPDAHDEATVESFRPLYDVVLEHVPDHGWTVWEADDAAGAPTFRGSTVPPGGSRGSTPEAPPTVPMPYAFDTVLDLVSVERRRTLLYYLKDSDGGALALSDVVDGVVTRERSIPKREAPETRAEVVTALRHVHIPKLADVGLLEYDAASGTIYYHQNEALESCLQYIETLELG